MGSRDPPGPSWLCWEWHPGNRVVLQILVVEKASPSSPAPFPAWPVSSASVSSLPSAYHLGCWPASALEAPSDLPAAASLVTRLALQVLMAGWLHSPEFLTGQERHSRARTQLEGNPELQDVTILCEPHSTPCWLSARLRPDCVLRQAPSVPPG